MNNKLLDDAKKAGFYVSDEGFIFHFDGFDINRQLAKFAALQIPDGYDLVKNEDYKNEDLEIPTLEQMREIFARCPNKNMQTITFDADLFKLVPIETTDEMRQAGVIAYYAGESFDVTIEMIIKLIYKSMIAASQPTNTEEN